MKKIIIATALCSTIVFASSTQYKYELTPMLGGTYTEGNLGLKRDYANAGLSLGFNLEESIFDQIELGVLQSLGKINYKNNQGSTDITRVFSNVVKNYPLSNSSSLYALVGAGVEVFSNEENRNETGVFGNYGLGYKYKFDNDMALKFDLRHLIETDRGDNTLLYTLGLAIPFGQKAVHNRLKQEPLQKEIVEEKAVVEPIVEDIDSDGDGVVDRLDSCPNSEKNAVVDKTGCAIVVNLKVLFDFDKAVIKQDYNSKLSRFAQVLKNYPAIKTKLSAHTDNIGEDSYNLELSKQRAAAVKNALITLGIDENRITSVGYGETKPIATNKTAQGRALNRRVEATVTK